jgi:hypothetical protein
MSAERMREAAARLREAAIHDENLRPATPEGDLSQYMTADVALALADWLDATAYCFWDLEDHGECASRPCPDHRAIQAADAILGSES